MSGFGLEGFAAVRPVRVDLLTARYLVSGTILTRFSRVAEILNQLTSTHLPIDDARVHEHGHEADDRARTAIVAVDEILVMTAPDLDAPAAAGEMRVPKQTVHARLALGAIRVAGTVYVPVGSRPMDGLLNVPDRFMPMTDVEITSAEYTDLDRRAPVAAVRRDRAHVVLFDDRPPAEPAATDSVTSSEQEPGDRGIT